MTTEGVGLLKRPKTRTLTVRGRNGQPVTGGTDAPVNQLQELIRHRMRDKGWTYDEVVDRARTAGAPVSKSTVHALATSKDLKRAPSREVLQGLAEGLDLPLVSVQRAALGALGWNLETVHSQEDELLIASWRELSERDRRTIQRMVEELRRNDGNG